MLLSCFNTETFDGDKGQAIIPPHSNLCALKVPPGPLSMTPGLAAGTYNADSLESPNKLAAYLDSGDPNSGPHVCMAKIY